MDPSAHKTMIDQKLATISIDSIEYIYGGVTEDTLKIRKSAHVKNKQPPTCDNTWKIETVTSILITNEYTKSEFKKLIKEVENYIINSLDAKFGSKCQNDRNKNNAIAQRGGAGISVKNIGIGDNYKIYICYKNKMIFV